MKIFEKFKEMPLKVKLASTFLVLMTLFLLYIIPGFVIAIALAFSLYLSLIEVIKYFGWFK